MAKRMISTDLFKDPFVKSLDGSFKVLYIYILTDCDHAGIWTQELDVASMRCGFNYDIQEVKEVFKDKFVFLEDIWFIPGFIKFQYGELNEKNRVHNSVLSRLQEKCLVPYLNKISPLQAPYEGVKDKDKDKDKDNSGILNKKNVQLIQKEIDWLKENHSYDASEEIGYLTSLNNRLKNKRESTGRTTEDEDIFHAFCFFIDHKPEWFSYFSMKSFDNNFESLQKAIKDKIEEENKEFHPTIERI